MPQKSRDKKAFPHLITIITLEVIGHGRFLTSIYRFLGLNLGIERNNYQGLTLLNHNSTNNLNAYEFFL